MAAIPAHMIAEIKRLRATGLTGREISDKTGVSKTAIYRALSPPPPGHQPDPSIAPKTREDARRLMRQIPPDTRSLTARLAGDPLPGRSALDRQGA